MRQRSALVAALAALAAAAASGASALDLGTAACPAGSTAARIEGKRVCLRAGARCKRRLDRTYHRFRFHCHSGRLVRFAAPPGRRDVEITVIGEPEIVFDWSTQRCDDEDLPDMPARPFRDAAGNVQLIATHKVVRRMIGPDLETLRRQCAPVMTSHADARPEAFDDSEWLNAPYTNDGRIVYALVHMEYHGQDHGSAWCPSGSNDACWYDAVTLAVSTDGGASYSHAPPPSHLVAALPFRYVPDRAGMGYTGGTNIVRHPTDGHYYAFIGVAAPAWPGGACIMRTPTLERPDSWRFWDGTSWAGAFVDPYTTEIADPRARLCTPRLDVLAGSLSWNTHLGKFLLIGDKASGSSGMFFYSLSDDLVRWTAPRLLLGVELTFTHSCGDRDPKAYASFIDPTSPSRSFDVTGKRGWLYYTQFNYAGCRMTLDRDLMRVPIEISR